MKEYILILSVISTMSLFAQSGLSADAKPVSSFTEPKGISKLLSLKSVLEQGLRANPEQKIRDYQKMLIDLQSDDNFDRFWYPNISLIVSSGEHNIDRLKTANDRGENKATTARAPTGYVGLELGEYTVFNWGKDYLQYLNNKFLYKQELENLVANRRQLKFKLIQSYFNLGRLKSVLKIKQEQLRSASFVYRLSREKASLKKIGKQGYYQTRQEFLRSQAEYHNSKSEVIDAEQEMAQLVGDRSGTRYRVSEALMFKELQISGNESTQLAGEKNNDLQNSKLNFDNADRSYQIAKKDNMPLPKFTVNLGTYKKNFGPDTSSTSFETHTGNSNIELVASVNLSWTLLGEGGLFNKRRVKKAFLNKRISEVQFSNTKRTVGISIKTLHRKLKELERQIGVGKLRSENSKKAFQITMDNYLNKKTRFVNFRAQLLNSTQSQIFFQNAKYIHLVNKLQLADTIGLEDFPGENFEQLASREIKL